MTKRTTDPYSQKFQIFISTKCKQYAFILINQNQRPWSEDRNKSKIKERERERERERKNYSGLFSGIRDSEDVNLRPLDLCKERGYLPWNRISMSTSIPISITWFRRIAHNQLNNVIAIDGLRRRHGRLHIQSRRVGVEEEGQWGVLQWCGCWKWQLNGRILWFQSHRRCYCNPAIVLLLRKEGKIYFNPKIFVHEHYCHIKFWNLHFTPLNLHKITTLV